MLGVLLFCILLAVFWPIAILVILVLPFILLILLPFTVLGAVIGGMLSLFVWLVTLPVRLLLRF